MTDAPRPGTDPWLELDAALPLLAATYGRAGVRMTAIGLEGGGFAVVSPGTRGEAAREALRARGAVRFLLAPNHFHNAGLADWQAAFPDARLVAHPTAIPRLRRKVPGASFGDLEALRAALPAGVRLLSPPMARQGETWIAVQRPGLSALVVCDAWVHLEVVDWTYRLAGFRPGLMVNPLFKRLFLRSKADFKAWAARELAEIAPDLLVPAHGAVMRGEGTTAALLRVTEQA